MNFLNSRVRTRLNSLPAAALALGASSLVASVPAQAQNPAFAIKDGDRVVFYGDSITDSRQYTTMVETFIKTRFPSIKPTFTHSGWGGDRVGGGGGGNINTRLQRDVLAYKPTVVTIMLGMNDGGYRAYDQGIFDTYSRGYENIVKTLKEQAPGVRITAIQPSPYDDVTRAPTFEGGYNAVLLKFSDFVKQLAQRENLGTADLNTPVVEMLRKANATDPATAARIIGDRVHPGSAGHLIMAGSLLKAWGAPAIVTAVEIDANGKKVVKAENTAVSGLEAGESLKWKQHDKALPFPLNRQDGSVALVLRSSDFEETLNQQPLKVSGLTAPKYSLKIDGTAVGTFTKEELAQGINLAVLNTPMVDQAKRVSSLTWERSNLHNTRWRNVQVPLAGYTSPDVKAAVDKLVAALDKEVERAAGKQHEAAQPVPHNFELTPDA